MRREIETEAGTTTIDEALAQELDEFDWDTSSLDKRVDIVSRFLIDQSDATRDALGGLTNNHGRDITYDVLEICRVEAPVGVVMHFAATVCLDELAFEPDYLRASIDSLNSVYAHVIPEIEADKAAGTFDEQKWKARLEQIASTVGDLMPNPVKE